MAVTLAVLGAAALGSTVGVPAGRTAAVAAPAPDEETQTRGELDRVEQALAAQRKVLEQLRAREGSVLDALMASDRALAESRAEQAAIGAELAEVQAKLAETLARTRTLEDELGLQRRALEARAVALYKLGPLGPVEALLSARSLADLARRTRYLRAVLEADRVQVRRYESGRTALERESSALARQQHELARLARRQAEMADRLHTEQRARRDLLAAVQGEQALAEKATEELEAAAEALKALLARLEAEAVARALQGEQARPAGGFAAARGRLAPPVAGEVVTPFGPREHPRFRTVTVSNGIEIRAPAGTDVRAVAEGRVVFAGWFRGYGKMLILDHGDQFYTLYAHAAELYKAVGETVRQGDRVASVGDTGTLGDPVLYFEIRQAGKPLDPADWLSVSEARRQ